jgi:hypothetical protein
MADVMSRAGAGTRTDNAAQQNVPTIWTGSRDKTIEGFTMTAELHFKGKVYWGPAACHSNAVNIQNALQNADHRLFLKLQNRDKSNEGVTCTLSLKKNGDLLLNGFPIHDNMVPMAGIIKTIWSLDPPPN